MAPLVCALFATTKSKPSVSVDAGVLSDIWLQQQQIPITESLEFSASVLRFRRDPAAQLKQRNGLKTTIEYRISEEHAGSIFSPNEGLRVNKELRLIKLSADDPRWQPLAELYWRHERKGFYGWTIKREYSAAEIDAAKLHLLRIKASIVPTGEECGTLYEDSEMCPLCGCGRVQASPLRLRLSRLPGRAGIAESWAGEVIISTRLVRPLIDSGITVLA